MDILNFITGQGGLMILGLIVLFVFIHRKYREKRYFEHIEKQDKKRKNKPKN